MSEPSRSGRRIAAAVMAALTLLVLGTLMRSDHARLARLEQAMKASDHAAEIAQLSSRYESLASDVHSLKAMRRPDSEGSIDTLKVQWEERLSALEDSAHACATAHDLVELTDRMDVVETRLSRASRKPAASAAAPTPASSTLSAASPLAKLDPPFLPLGIELRGGERFLSIVPAGASSIAQARALRLGEREGNWVLEHLERGVAQFRVEGQIQRLGIPQ